MILFETAEGERQARPAHHLRRQTHHADRRHALEEGRAGTDAPDVIYLEDTDGDGKADIRRVVLTGFAFTNPQHTVNNPVYGLDNWIYLAHEGPAGAIIFTDKFGDRGQRPHFPDRPDGPVAQAGAAHGPLPARYARTGISRQQHASSATASMPGATSSPSATRTTFARK